MTLTTRTSAMGQSGSVAVAIANPRAHAFCLPGGPEVFHAVAHRHEIWRPDPFDVESIHEEAREAFRSLVARASRTPRPISGRILLLKGESGSGKTHLMRVFRNWLQGGQKGYCGYMQMTSATNYYGRYALNNLIDSLSQPYYEPHGETTGLMRLSTKLVESTDMVPLARLDELREEAHDSPLLTSLVEKIADAIVSDERFDNFDLDIIRALLFLQHDDPRIRARVLKYLRCEDLSSKDRELLGGIVPRIYPEAAERVIAHLGDLMGLLEGVPLVLCLDQLEDMYDPNDSTRFSRVISLVCDIADRVPSSVLVISCLEDFYEKLKTSLATPARTRLEYDPAPIRLSAQRDLPEVVELVRKRLEGLYESHGVEIDEADPTYPIPKSELSTWCELPTRLLLQWCQNYHERCVDAGEVVVISTAESSPMTSVLSEPDPIRLEQLWNDARSESRVTIPAEEEELAELLASAIHACSEEAPAGHRFLVTHEGTTLRVEHLAGEQTRERLYIGICNRVAQGGGLGKQVNELERLCGDAGADFKPVIVRSIDFPSSPTAQISKKIGKLVQRGGRRIVVEDADWRALLIMQTFRRKHASDPNFAHWLQREQPLSRLKSLREILHLNHQEVIVTPPERLIPDMPPVTRVELETDNHKTETASLPPLLQPIVLGQTTGIHGSTLTIEPTDLRMHAAFLGASGSGKTTVALAIIEQLLLQGIPAILVDRKGDLCRYAVPEAWTGELASPALETRRAALQRKVEVAIYTPGNPKGRPLSIAAVPPGLGKLNSSDRGDAARYAARALGGMMNYKPDKNRGDGALVAILTKAIEILAQARPDHVVSVGDLKSFIDEQDPSLVNAVGSLDTKLFARLVQDLEVLSQMNGKLLSAEGEPLDAEALFGIGSYATPGKTRLTIISTKSLGTNQDIQFWVAQFLMEMSRWTSRSPSKTLQAVLMFDEADLYLPATRQPPTKEPMENLLKRARSAGLGLMLATQSPGDFDYKCRENIRSWFVGRVKEPTALGKMKPMLSDCRVDVASKLPSQTTGQFHLLSEGKATAFSADRSVITTEQLAEDEILTLARLSRAPCDV